METTTAPSAAAHAATVAEHVGLGVVASIIDVLLDRGAVQDAQVLSLTPDDIAVLYHTVIGPAIDRVEDQLLAR